MTDRPPISDAFFNPGRVAVIGATNKLGFGFGVPKYLIEHGYRDRIYLINPKQTELFGQPVYPSITDVPAEIDLAIVVTPAPIIPEIIAGCLEKGVRSIIIESAGFSETGPEGRQLERTISDMVAGTSTRIIGPNCVGVVNPHNGFATTEISFAELKPGHIAVVAQSGVFGNILMDWAPTQNLGLSKVITIGNRLDVDECDVLAYLAEDETTRVIALYMEGVKDGARFLKTARRVAGIKPVIILKSGRTEAGSAATASHTGSLAGNDLIYSGIFRQCGLIRANNFLEMFDMAKAFATQPIPSEPTVAVVTSSGSLGAMTTDACISLGLNLPSFPKEAVNKISSRAPAWMNIRNPVDVGPSGLFGPAMATAMETAAMNSFILIPVLPQMVLQEMKEADKNMDMSTWLGDIREIRRKYPEKPVITVTLGSHVWMQLIRDFLGDEMPILNTPENAARAVAELYNFGLRRQSPFGGVFPDSPFK
ncbi:MAG: CoA-binding protein [Desulfobacterales bacterium]|nr:CoA-binding protein [Desulfobacterales bacterium]